MPRPASDADDDDWRADLWDVDDDAAERMLPDADQLAGMIAERFPADLAAMAGDPAGHAFLDVNVMTLLDDDPLLAHLIYRNPTEMLARLNDALLIAQGQDGNRNARVRLFSMPLDRFATRRTVSAMRADDDGRLVDLHGTVVRVGAVKVLESERQYLCKACGTTFAVQVDLQNGTTIASPAKCPSSRACRSKQFTFVEGSRVCTDYQEIRVQENVTALQLGSIPRSTTVILRDGLVDTVQPGTGVVVTGIVRVQWAVPGPHPERPCLLRLFVDAIHIDRASSATGSGISKVGGGDTRCHRREFRAFWREHARRGTLLDARRAIVESVCPHLYEMTAVKLAVALSLIGGVASDGDHHLRGHSHLLLVGSAGTGKSQLLQYAAKLMPRSVVTTGIGTTAAGLTAACVRDADGQMALEAGALVLADGGLCCIDEFGAMRPADRAAIHEAMEQQSISVAKGGLVCTLNTRCTVIAAMNPPAGSRLDVSGDLAASLGIASSLLSRFDMIMLLLDNQDPAWDEGVADYVVNGTTHAAGRDGGWPLATLRAYFDLIRCELAPVMTPFSQLILSKYYRLQRNSPRRSTSRTTLRLMESLVRLAQAHARLMFRKRVLAMDAIQAVICLECSQHTSVLLGATNVLHTKPSDDLQAEYDRLEQVILRRLELGPVPEEDRQYDYFDDDDDDDAGDDSTNNADVLFNDDLLDLDATTSEPRRRQRPTFL